MLSGAATTMEQWIAATPALALPLPAASWTLRPAIRNGTNCCSRWPGAPTATPANVYSSSAPPIRYGRLKLGDGSGSPSARQYQALLDTQPRPGRARADAAILGASSRRAMPCMPRSTRAMLYRLVPGGPAASDTTLEAALHGDAVPAAVVHHASGHRARRHHAVAACMRLRRRMLGLEPPPPVRLLRPAGTAGRPTPTRWRAGLALASQWRRWQVTARASAASWPATASTIYRERGQERRRRQRRHVYGVGPYCC